MKNETTPDIPQSGQAPETEPEQVRRLELLSQVYQAAGLTPRHARQAALADLRSLFEWRSWTQYLA